MHSHQKLVTVAVPGTDPEGENRTCKALFVASVEQQRCRFFCKQVNRVVLGVLRWGFACDCDQYLSVLIVFMLWVRFLDHFCCFLLLFVVFLCFSCFFCCFGGFIC